MGKIFWVLVAVLWTMPVAAQGVFEGSAQWPDLSEAASASGGGGSDAALIVGIEDYVFAPDVDGANLNARDWYVFLTKTRKVPVSNVFLLRNQEGSRENILEKAREASARVGEGGTLWFVYIGHGAPSRDGKDGVLVGVDAQQSAASLYARSVAKSELVEVLKQGRQARSVVLLDACFSGRSGSGDMLVPGLQPLLPVEDEAGDVVVITAGTSNQFAGALPGTKRPAFSYLALGALRGWGDLNNDGAVTPEEVAGYTRDALRVLLRDRSQTPTVSGPELSLSLSADAGEEGPDLSEFVLVSAAPSASRGAVVADDAREAEPLPSLGFLRLGFGLTRFSAASLDNQTSAKVDHNSNTIFTEFPLDIRGTKQDPSPLGLSAQFTWGQEGLVLGSTFGIGRDESYSAATRVSTLEDSFSSDVTQLVAGVDGTINSYLHMALTADAMYRLVFDPMAFFIQAGAGLDVGIMNVDFTIDDKPNSVTSTTLNFLFPLRAGADVRLYKNIFAHASYTLYLSPSSSDAFEAGIGFLY